MGRTFTVPVKAQVTQPMYYNIIRPKLTAMGYDFTVLITTWRFTIYAFNGNLYSGTHVNFPKKSLSVHDNINLFVAIAGISDGDVIYPGEWVQPLKTIDGVFNIKQTELYEAAPFVENAIGIIDPADGYIGYTNPGNFKKATLDQLIEKFQYDSQSKIDYQLPTPSNVQKTKSLKSLVDDLDSCQQIFHHATGCEMRNKWVVKNQLILSDMKRNWVRIYFNGNILGIEGSHFSLIDFIRSLGYEPVL